MDYAFKDQETDAPVYIIKHGVADDICDKIVADLKDKTTEAFHEDGGKLTSSKGGPRNSSVHWFTDNGLKAQLNSWVNVANYQAGWRYDVTDCELFQFTKYDGAKKQYYNWHSDGQGCNYSQRSFTFGKPNSLLEVAVPGLVGTVRKISISVLLNDDFEGGDFETMYLSSAGKTKVNKIKAEKGSVLLFPSYLNHRVRPVTKGVRYSLVVWYGGPPFK